MAKFTCPFCISQYNIKEVQYVCPDCGTIVTPGRFASEPIKCSNSQCGGLATVRRCPKCGDNIPKVALETPNLPFSIVGVSNSGKTNFITVMLHELGRSPGINLALGHQTKETSEIQNENRRRIYERKIVPDATAAGYNRPQIWYIKNLAKRKGNEVPTYTFTIFDGAGEDHEREIDPSSTVCRYINASEAIIMAIDPLVLSGIRRGGVVDPTTMANSLGGDTNSDSKNAEEIINSVAEYIKTARGIKTNQVLKIPVAVVLTKFDTVINHHAFGNQALVKNSSMTIRNGKVDLAEIKQVDNEIRNFLNVIGEGSFIRALDSHFKDYYFFGVSSYGAPPKNAQDLPDIKPHRVLDPVMWLFKRAKFVD